MGRRRDDGIVLHAFGPFLGTPDSSPFVIKAMLLLELAGLPFRVERGGLGRAPKGLLPYLRDDGAVVADSTFIRRHIERKYGFDFDQGLTAEQKAIAWSVERLCEDHLYWALLELRWADAENFARGLSVMFRVVPAPVRPLAKAIMRRRTLRRLHAQGMGRFTQAEIADLAQRDIAALATLIGDKPYLMGRRPCGADATVFGLVCALLTPELKSPAILAALAEPRLVAYRDRIAARWFASASA